MFLNDTTSEMIAYTHVRDLPSGGETEVFLAQMGDELVVMKRPRTKRGSQQMMREYDAVSKLQGTSGIAVMTTCFVERQRFTLVYPYFPNGDLLNVLDAGVCLDVKNFARTLVQTMEQMHAKGFAHRDIKPENIVFDVDYTFKLIDFGMATTDKLSRVRIGTKNYCAPEVLSGKEYVPSQADVWSFGALMVVVLFRSDALQEGVFERIDFPVFWRDMATTSPVSVDKDSKQFLERVLQPEEARPSARQLLEDPWLN